MNSLDYSKMKNQNYVLCLLTLVVLIGVTGCNAFKIVRVPVPIPTLGLIGNEPKTEKVAQAKPVLKTKEVVVTEKGKVYYGKASWYGRKFHSRQTASGEPFNMYELTAAHPTLPFNTKVRVTNMKNGQECIVRINDRGPFKKGRVIDVSMATARKLDFENDGITDVKIEVI